MKDQRKKSIILLSGGLDSAANLALAVERDEPLLAVTADYGQRAAVPEFRAAVALSEYFGVEHQRVALPWLGSLGGNSLTDPSQDLPKISARSLDDLAVTQASAKSVWVPNRNGVLLNIGAAFAEKLGAEQVVVGFNREEAVTFPDNSEAFLRLASHSFSLSTLSGVRAHSYTSQMDKREIVRTLLSQKFGGKAFPFDLLWSCYEAGPKICGVCESCLRWERAKQASL
ncbi:7-cyano-7-deazaguanine synthase QueC [bacterium]|jgi:7-cyano-7-deazaguanine synthase|nr:7-cyano-7-deazaguanine synthase QueC [bacterium]